MKNNRFKIEGELKFDGSNKLKITIKRNGKTWANIGITNGSIAWFPKYGKIGRRFPWPQFATMMDS